MRGVGVIASVLCFQFALLGQGQQVGVEKDLPGQKEVPATAYYGVQTARAL